MDDRAWHGARDQCGRRAARTGRSSLIAQLEPQFARLVRHLSLDPGQPMPRGLVPRRAGSVLQASQRERLRRDEITDAMLVMNGERLGGFTGNVCRTAMHVDQPAPVPGGLVEL